VWRKNQQRILFDQFAKSKGFNPLDVAGWYSTTRKQLESAVCCIPLYLFALISFSHFMQQVSRVLSFYNGSYVKAITALYPELQLNKSFFKSKGLVILFVV
jgi:hypothetical protein